MEFVTQLWLPILLSAVLVFIASSIIHMVLGYHKNDYRKLPDEDKVQATLRSFNIPAGDYFLPYCASSEEMKKPEHMEKVKAGPVLVMSVFPPGGFGMGQSLVLWFLFSILVGLFAAYVGFHAVGEQPTYLAVFRFVGTSAFMGYALGQIPASIWYKKSWCTTLRLSFDGLVYALLTAGVFGWLWPR